MRNLTLTNLISWCLNVVCHERKMGSKRKKTKLKKRKPAGFRKIWNYHCKALYCFLYKERKKRVYRCWKTHFKICVHVGRSVMPNSLQPMDCSLPGSSVHGILQARILEWVAISFSRGSSRPRDRTHISYISCTDR